MVQLDYNKILETYSIEEILDYNDLSLPEITEALYLEGLIQLPPIPVDADEET